MTTGKFTANPGAGGFDFAADLVGTERVPYSKIDIGAEGISNPVNAANPLPVTLSASGPSVTATTLTNTRIGDIEDPAASADTGSFSLNALIKRGLANWTTLLGRVPASAIANIAGTVQTHDSVAGATPTGQVLLAVRRDSDTPPAADGDFTYLVVNEQGRLKTAGAPAQFTPVTGAITAAAQTVNADVTQASNVMFYVTGVFAGHNSTFEGSIDGGTSWFAWQAIRSNANTIDLTTGVLGAAPAYAWEASVNALTNFRIRCTAHTSGTANWRITLGSYATEPIPAAQVSATQPVSGTVTATVTGGTVVGVTPTVTNAILSSAATTNGTVAKASAGTIYGVVASNTGAAVAFLKLHNSTSVTVGTTAVALTIPIPAGSVVAVAYGSQGMRYGTGICYSITNLAADADTTAVTLNQVKVNLSYI